MAKKLISVTIPSTDGSTTAWSSLAATTATGTYHSNGIQSHFSEGQTALLVLTSAGSLAITFELSTDGTDWYEPVNTAGTKVNSIRSGLGANAWIVFTPQVAEWIRFKLVLTGANSTVSVKYIQQEEA